MTENTSSATAQWEQLVSSKAANELAPAADKAFDTAFAAANEAGLEEGTDEYAAKFMEAYTAEFGITTEQDLEEAAKLELIPFTVENIPVEGEVPDEPAEDPKHCTFVDGDETCDRDIYAKNFCRKHYELWRETDPSRPECSVEGCDGKVYSLGMCRHHYTQQRSSRNPNTSRLTKEEVELIRELSEKFAKYQPKSDLVPKVGEILDRF